MSTYFTKTKFLYLKVSSECTIKSKRHPCLKLNNNYEQNVGELSNRAWTEVKMI